MTETDDLEERLRAMGRAAVDPDVAGRHLAAIAVAGAGATAGGGHHFRFGWKAVAAAGIAGFLAGSTGLAAAGSLPDPAQDVAHDVLGAVGIDVPRSAEGCPEGQTFRNHGEYVSSVEAAGGDVEAAARSGCGKPVHAGGPGGNGGGNGGGNAPEPGTPRPDTDGNPCTGPPPWAGAHLGAEERAALQEQHRAQCGADEDPDETTPTTG